jgi:hypothetical protein
MIENHDTQRSPIYCCYCGSPYPLTDQMRSSGPIVCETCGGTQYVNQSGRHQPRYHIIEVICPNRKCSERTLVNKLEREGKTKTGCHACDEQILIQTDNQGKLKGITLIKKSRTLTTKQWLGVLVGVLLMGYALGALFHSVASTPPATANTVLDDATRAKRDGTPTGASLTGGRAVTPSGEPSPSPVQGEVANDEQSR